ncbi:hypothetical protein V8C86DRAFT_1215400 [Haematococcus lacustris]
MRCVGVLRLSLAALLCVALTTPGGNAAAGPFSWFDDAQAAGSSRGGEEGLAHMVALMGTLQALAAKTGQGPGLMAKLRNTVAAPALQLAQHLQQVLGPDLVRLQAPPTASASASALHAAEGARGGAPLSLHIDIGRLLDLPASQLDAQLLAVVQQLGGQASQPGNQGSSTDGGEGLSSGASSGSGVVMEPNTEQQQQQQGGKQGLHETPAPGSPVDAADTPGQSPDSKKMGVGAGSEEAATGHSRMLQQQGSAGSVTGPAADTTTLFQQTISLTASDASIARRANQAERRAKIRAAVEAALSKRFGFSFAASGSENSDESAGAGTSGGGVGLLGAFQAAFSLNGDVLRNNVMEAGRLVVDALINNAPRIRGPARLSQLFQVLADVFTSGEGLAGGCTPYIFDGGGIPLPEQVVFPSFSVSQTTGNCALIPEIIGNTEQPGQWALLNSRVACLGPATEYLLLPAVYRGTGTTTERFTTPTCRNEFTVGPALVLTLAGGGKDVTYANRAEFLAAVRTNLTFGWGEGGLDAALQLLQQKLVDRKEVKASWREWQPREWWPAYGWPAGQTDATAAPVQA